MAGAIKEHLLESRRQRRVWAYGAFLGLCGYPWLCLLLINWFPWIALDHKEFNGFIDSSFVSIFGGIACFAVWLEKFVHDVSEGARLEWNHQLAEFRSTPASSLPSQETGRPRDSH